MSKEAASKFVQAILNDEELRQRTADIKPEEIVPFAKEMGYDFTLDELKEVKDEDIELSPDELEGVAGGGPGHSINAQSSRNKKNLREREETFCKRDGVETGFRHQFVKTGHIEEPVLWGLFGDFTDGFDLYTCKLCKYVKKVHV